MKSLIVLIVLFYLVNCSQNNNEDFILWETTCILAPANVNGCAEIKPPIDVVGYQCCLANYSISSKQLNETLTNVCTTYSNANNKTELAYDIVCDASILIVYINFMFLFIICL